MNFELLRGIFRVMIFRFHDFPHPRAVLSICEVIDASSCGVGWWCGWGGRVGYRTTQWNRNLKVSIINYIFIEVRLD